MITSNSTGSIITELVDSGQPRKYIPCIVKIFKASNFMFMIFEDIQLTVKIKPIRKGIRQRRRKRNPFSWTRKHWRRSSKEWWLSYTRSARLSSQGSMAKKLLECLNIKDSSAASKRCYGCMSTALAYIFISMQAKTLLCPMHPKEACREDSCE